MQQKDIFLELLEASHDENHWFVCLRQALEGLSEQEAAWKQADHTNSIWEIVNHLWFWNNRYLNRWKGIPVPEMEGTNDSTFVDPNDNNWSAAIKRLDDVLFEWQTQIREVKEEKLNQPFSDDISDQWSTVLCNLTAHNAYHAGQIVHIRKAQGSWDTKKGVH